MHLAPAAQVHGGRHRQQCHADGHDQQHAPQRRVGDHREERPALEVESERADDHRDDDHRMQADQPALEEFARRHAGPAVVVRIADDEAGEQEEEVHGQVAVVDDLCEAADRVGLAQVERDDRERRDAAQAVEDRVMTFGVGERAAHGFPAGQ